MDWLIENHPDVTQKDQDLFLWDFTENKALHPRTDNNVLAVRSWEWVKGK